MSSLSLSLHVPHKLLKQLQTAAGEQMNTYKKDGQEVMPSYDTVILK